MHRRFIAIVLSAALAITSIGVAPARANDTEKWIAGAAALAIIGLAIHEEKKKKRKRRAAQHYYETQRTEKEHYRRNKYLPAGCRVTKYVHGQKIRGFARGCLKRNNIDVRALPGQCKYRVHNPNNGKRNVIFGSRCLRDAGYRIGKVH